SSWPSGSPSPSASSSASTRPAARPSWTRSRPCGTSEKARIAIPRIKRETAVNATEDRQQSGGDFGYDARHGDIAMPIHDWSRVPSGLFHHFHQSWSIRITDALNAGRLPDGVEALVEQRTGPKESDVLAIEVGPGWRPEEGLDGGVATLPPPSTRIVRRT